MKVHVSTTVCSTAKVLKTLRHVRKKMCASVASSRKGYIITAKSSEKGSRAEGGSCFCVNIEEAKTEKEVTGVESIRETYKIMKRRGEGGKYSLPLPVQQL